MNRIQKLTLYEKDTKELTECITDRLNHSHRDSDTESFTSTTTQTVTTGATEYF
jgi:hypothetical protein